MKGNQGVRLALDHLEVALYPLLIPVSSFHPEAGLSFDNNDANNPLLRLLFLLNNHNRQYGHQLHQVRLNHFVRSFQGNF